MSKILIVAAVEKELSPFMLTTEFGSGRWHNYRDHQVWISFTGVGAVASAYHIQKLVYELRPDLVIQAGIAGGYAGSGLKTGDTVTVIRERLADLGAVIGSDFSAIFPENESLENPYRLSGAHYPEVSGFTVNTGCSPTSLRFQELYSSDAASVETMEGYSLFYVCLRMEVPFLALRTVSNLVSSGREGWDIPLATRNLAKALLDTLELL